MSSKALELRAKLSRFKCDLGPSTEQEETTRSVQTAALSSQHVQSTKIEVISPTGINSSGNKDGHQDLNTSKSPSKSLSRSKEIFLSRQNQFKHLTPLTPLLKPSLKCVFIGFNPGVTTALKGHYYAHRSNLFWRLLYESGCVDQPLTYLDDKRLVDEYNIGLTDLVARPTGGINDLSPVELRQSVPILEARLMQYNPRVLCIVGKGIWDNIYRVSNGKPLKNKDFEWGFQPQGFAGCDQVYVVPSTSGLAAGVSRAKKLELWTQLAVFLSENDKIKRE